MNENILDAIDGQTEQRGPNIIKWTSLVLLWIGVLWFFAIGCRTDFNTITIIGLLSLATWLTYAKEETGVKFTLFVICLGIFNLVSLFPISNKIGIFIGPIFLGFEVITVILAILHYSTNLKVLQPMFLNIMVPSEEELQAASRTRINGFKARFSNKSIEELEQIIESKKLVPEAISASKELIIEKKHNQNKM